MSVKIRLSRVGRTHLPFFRLVAVDSRKKRDGKVLANLGTYDTTASKIVQFHEDLYKEWVDKGAQPSDSAKKIYRQFKREGVAPQAAAPKQELPKKAPSKAAPKQEAKKTESPEATVEAAPQEPTSTE